MSEIFAINEIFSEPDSKGVLKFLDSLINDNEVKFYIPISPLENQLLKEVGFYEIPRKIILELLLLWKSHSFVDFGLEMMHPLIAVSFGIHHKYSTYFSDDGQSLKLPRMDESTETLDLKTSPEWFLCSVTRRGMTIGTLMNKLFPIAVTQGFTTTKVNIEPKNLLIEGKAYKDRMLFKSATIEKERQEEILNICAQLGDDVIHLLRQAEIIGVERSVNLLKMLDLDYDHHSTEFRVAFLTHEHIFVKKAGNKKIGNIEQGIAYLRNNFPEITPPSKSKKLTDSSKKLQKERELLNAATKRITTVANSDNAKKGTSPKNHP